MFFAANIGVQKDVYRCFYKSPSYSSPPVPYAAPVLDLPVDLSNWQSIILVLTQLFNPGFLLGF